jgi:phosphoribosyl-dephospho-CoA transferase
MQSLGFLEIELASFSNEWGPGGSVGYELASRAPVVTQESDLDLVISAPDRLGRDFAQHLWKTIALAPAKVDVRIETAWCGFSLEEYVRRNSEKLLVRTSTGPDSQLTHGINRQGAMNEGRIPVPWAGFSGA